MISSGVANYVQQLEGVTFLQEKQVPRTQEESLKMVTRQFEAIFLEELLKEMRNTTLDSGLFGKDRASQMYQSMHDEALSAKMAETGELGIGRMLYTQLARGKKA